MVKRTSDVSKPQKICASTAKADFKLTDRDLDSIGCEYVRNPHYRCAPSMRLYLLSDIIKLSEEKQRRLEYNETHWEEIQAEKKKQKLELRQKELTEIREKVSHISSNSVKQDRKEGQMMLPRDVLENIVDCLVSQYECFGIYNCNMVTKDLIALSEASIDLKNVVRDYALPKLCSRVRCRKRLNNDVHAALDKCISAPNDTKLKELKMACSVLDLKVSGTKAELIYRILEYFKLSGCCYLPAKVRLELLIERKGFSAGQYFRPCKYSEYIYRLMDDYTFNNRLYISDFQSQPDIVFLYQFYKSDYEMSDALEALRQRQIHSYKDFKAYNKHVDNLIVLRLEEIKETRRQEMIARGLNVCDCGQLFSKKCVNVACRTCCQTMINYCPFHGK